MNNLYHWRNCQRRTAGTVLSASFHLFFFLLLFLLPVHAEVPNVKVTKTNLSKTNGAPTSDISYEQLLIGARKQIDVENYQEAMMATLFAMDKDTNRFEAYQVASFIALKKSRFDDARFFVEEALKRSPNSAKTNLVSFRATIDKRAEQIYLALLNAGHECFRTNAFKLANDYSTSAIGVSSNRYEGHFLQALCLKHLGEKESSQAAATRALNLAPEPARKTIKNLLIEE